MFGSWGFLLVILVYAAVVALILWILFLVIRAAVRSALREHREALRAERDAG